MEDGRSLRELRADFLAGSTRSLPIAGLAVWSALGVASLWLSQVATATAALYIMCAIMPLAFLLDRARGRNLFAGGTENPLTVLFLTSIASVAATVPLVVIGARADPTLLVLGMAILAGLVWIPYGWAADDPVGLRHAIARAAGCYAAYALCPRPWTAAAICAVVAVAYAYSLSFMRPPGLVHADLSGPVSRTPACSLLPRTPAPHPAAARHARRAARAFAQGHVARAHQADGRRAVHRGGHVARSLHGHRALGRHQRARVHVARPGARHRQPVGRAAHAHPAGPAQTERQRADLDPVDGQVAGARHGQGRVGAGQLVDGDPTRSAQ